MKDVRCSTDNQTNPADISITIKDPEHLLKTIDASGAKSRQILS